MKITSSDSKKRMVKGQASRGKAKVPKHQVWCFQPKLENEAIVLHSILDIYGVEFYTRIVNDVRDLITSLVREHGFTDGAKRYNIIKNYVIDLVELREPVNPAWVSTSESYKVPSKLGETFIQLVVDCLSNSDTALQPKYYQAILTILNIVRMIDGLSDADYKSITDKSLPIDEELLKDFDTYVQNRLSPHKYDFSQADLSGYRFRLNKNGPNGMPKIESAHEEAILLLDSKLNRPFRSICDEMGFNYLYDYLSALKDFDPIAYSNQPGKSKEVTKLRKLVSVPDSGFKTRIVAIVDFWTQLVLEPIREHVQNVIKSEFRETDFRLNQDAGVASMVDFQKRCLNEEIHNGHKLDIRSLMFYDISSWTDRFHRDLQKVTMKHLFSPRLAESWAQLVVHCPWEVDGLSHTIKYGQGQGMGTNGSFDIATLTDHLFINFIIDQKSTISGLFRHNRLYGKVGDDLWIYDPDRLIERYYGEINLPINLSKSKEYSMIGSTAEFCSRTYLNGVDVSRISPKIISKSKDFRYLPTLLSLCSSRGVQLSRSSFSYLDNTVNGTEETYFDKLQNWIIGMACIGMLEPGSNFTYMNINYLEAGEWVTEKTKSLLADPVRLRKLAISYSIVEIASNWDDVKSKAAETLPLAYSIPWNDFNDLLSSKPFMNNDMQQGAEKLFGIDRLIFPREIVLVGRLIDQYRLITNLPNDMLMLSDDLYTPIEALLATLHQISIKSCYDSGNINYDVKRVYNTQFRIVKTLERLDEDYSNLTLDDSDMIRNIKSIMINDLPMNGWGRELPTLSVELSDTA